MLFQLLVSRDSPFFLSVVEGEVTMEPIKYQNHSNKLGQACWVIFKILETYHQVICKGVNNFYGHDDEEIRMLFKLPVSRDSPFFLSVVEGEVAMEPIKYHNHSNKLFANRFY